MRDGTYCKECIKFIKRDCKGLGDKEEFVYACAEYWSFFMGDDS